jgi:hypothetical protein
MLLALLLPPLEPATEDLQAALALVGLLAKGVAFLHDPDVELELWRGTSRPSV